MAGCNACQEASAAGPHPERQSRPVGSCAHAIHSFRPFDVGEVDCTGPVEALEYEHHVRSFLPRLGIADCESCHDQGACEVPDQAISMPGVLSATDEVAGRKIGSLPSTVTCPAARARGACRWTQVINEDDAPGLAVLNRHLETSGDSVDMEDGAREAVVEQIMGIFKMRRTR